ncbi:hypothetical protein C0995_009730, partial [Termitomyces sp. Mi166
NGIGVRMQKKHPPLAALVIAKCIKLMQVAKAFLKQQSKLSQFFVLDGYKRKRKAKALLELVDSDSNKEEEKERVHVIKKIKRKHIEELTGARKRKEIIELKNEEVEIVVPKTPLTSKPVVLVPSTPKPISKPIVALTSPVAGLSTAPIVPSSASKPAFAMPISKPAPVKSASKPAIKGGFVSKDSFIKLLRLKKRCKTKILVTDNNKDGNDDEDGKGDDDDSNDDDAAMDIDSSKHLEETQPTAPTKATVTEVEVPVPVPVGLLYFVHLFFVTILLANKTK